MNVLWSRVAIDDLIQIRGFVAGRDPVAAERMAEPVLAGVERLRDLPAMGRPRPGRVPNSRELALAGTPFVVVYRVRADTVAIDKVLHGARRWPPARDDS